MSTKPVGFCMSQTKKNLVKWLLIGCLISCVICFIINTVAGADPGSAPGPQDDVDEWALRKAKFDRFKPISGWFAGGSSSLVCIIVIIAVICLFACNS